MRLAVFTLTRDRLDYTKHCFDRLKRYAGVPYDHYVLDQGSTDGTHEWLYAESGVKYAEHLDGNIGISRGLNLLLERAGKNYDYYLKFDNDCEIVEPDTVKRVIDASDDHWILSPRVQGLNSPPPTGEEVDLNGERVGELGQIGGIFMLIPGWVFQTFRYDENNPTWGMDDVQLSQWFRSRQGRLGYLLDLPVNHYETTKGQWERYPAYFERKVGEGSPK